MVQLASGKLGRVLSETVFFLGRQTGSSRRRRAERVGPREAAGGSIFFAVAYKVRGLLNYFSVFSLEVDPEENDDFYYWLLLEKGDFPRVKDYLVFGSDHTYVFSTDLDASHKVDTFLLFWGNLGWAVNWVRKKSI